MKIPYYLLGDEIFPLESWLMRPYPGNQPEQEQIFNYRHSRARLTIENSFGILVARWRIFTRPIIASVDNIISYIMACICLHNYLRQTENSVYTPYGFIDVATKGCEIKEGEWRRMVQDNQFQPIPKLKGGRKKEDAKIIRETLKDYLNTENILSWQVAKVRNVGPTPSTNDI